MVFGIFRDVAKIVGTVTGAVIGVPLAILSETLSIPAEFVKEAMSEGCETYDEIRDWCKKNREW